MTSPTAAVEFLWSLPTDKIHVTAIHPDRRRPKNIEGRTYPRTGAGRADAQNWIEAGQKDGWGIYFNDNDLSVDLGRRHNKAAEIEVSHVRMMHVDADLPKNTKPDDFAAAKALVLEKIRAHRLPPSYIINSGNGYGVFWLLKERVATDADPVKIADCKARNRQLAIDIGGGADHCENLDRVMRVPGLINFPNEAKRKRGCVKVPTELVEFHPERIYDIEQFPPAPAEEPKSKKSKSSKKSKGNPGGVDEDPSDPATVDMTRLEPDSKVLRFIKDGPGEGADRSDAVYYVCCELCRRGWSNGDILSVLLNRDHRISDHLYAQTGRSPEDQARRFLADARNETAETVLSKETPYKSATLFRVARYPDLLNFQEEWLTWDRAAYVPLEDATIRAAVMEFLEGAKVRTRVTDSNDIARYINGPFNPKPTHINAVNDMLRSQCHKEVGAVTPPVFLTGRTDPPPQNVVSCRNGLVDITTGKLYDPTPDFFTRTALPINYDPNAPAPEMWLTFLADVTSERQGLINLIWEMFGYLISTDTSHQKVFFLYGNPRSGKGTVLRTLVSLIGVLNTCSPSIKNLAGTFGFQSMIGKTLAIVSDMATDSRTDLSAAASAINAVSGEDNIEANRKNKDFWNGRLAARFVLAGNDLPSFGAHTAALASRLLILPFEEDYLGREDYDLSNKLALELPSILNWAIAGLKSLRDRGRLEEPTDCRAAKSRLLHRGNPVLGFVHERCITEPAARVSKTDLYAAYIAYCYEHDLEHRTTEVFARELYKAAPGVRKKRGLSSRDRTQEFCGIRLVDLCPPEFSGSPRELEPWE
jgi:putative DNA primase/helicase